jgi:hypothetical protein
MAARELGDLVGEPDVELGHQRRAEFLTDCDPSAPQQPKPAVPPRKRSAACRAADR